MAQLQSTGVTGSLVVTGTITAQEFHTEFVSSSILHESGSTSFGNSSDDVHNMTGSLNLLGAGNFTGNMTANAFYGDGSNLTNVSSATNASTLDSLDSTQFLRSDTDDTYTGTLTVAGTIKDSGDSRRIHFMYGTTNSQPAIGVGEQGVYGMKIRWDSGQRIEFDGFWNTSVTGARNRDLGSIDVNNAIWELPSGVTINGSTAWHAGNDGANSGLDADTVDGIQGASFLRSDTSDTAAGQITFSQDISVGTQTGTWITSNVMSDAIGWNTSYGVYIGSNVGGTHYLRGNGTITTGGSTYNLWHAGNDGAGTGLDADLLDGQHASAFQTALTNPITGTGTANYLAKFTGTTSLGNSLVYDSGTKVGIGTNSPYGLVEIYGNGNSWGAGPAIRFWDSTNSKGWLAGNINNATAGDFYIRTLPSISGNPGTSNVEFTIKHSTGNVGIGTLSPSKTLHVYSGTDNEGIFMEGTGGGHWFNFKSGTSNLWSMGAQSGLMGWYNRTDSSYKMVITDGGNVGIGTTSPQKELEVVTSTSDFASVGVNQMSVGAWTGIHFGYKENNTNYRKSAIVFQRTDYLSNNAQGKIHILNGPLSGGGSATLADAHLTIGEEGYVGIGTTSPSSSLEVYGSGSTVLDIQGSQGQLFSITDNLTGDLFSVSDISGIPILNVNSSGDSYFDGSLGIGTTSLSSVHSLTVSGSSHFSGSVDVGTGLADTVVKIRKADNNVADHIQFYNGTTRVGEIGAEDDTWLRINQETAKNIYTPRYIRADAGLFVDSTSYGINGSGRLLDASFSGVYSNSISFSNSYTEFGNGYGSVSNDGSWNARVNIAGSSHARLDVKSVSDGIITSLFAHTGNNAGKIGTTSNHVLKLMVNGSDQVTIDSSSNVTATTFIGALTGTASNASALSSLALTGAGGIGIKLFNNQGRNHSTYTNFNDTAIRAGVNYLQGGTNGPTGTAGHQWYGFRLGLGDDYGTQTGASNNYASEIYWARAGQGGSQYLFARDMEGGNWSSWRKLYSGYADSAGAVAWGNVSGKPTTLSGFGITDAISTSTTQSNNLYIRGTSPTIYLRDTDHISSMIHCNSNLFYILRADAADDTGWTTYSSTAASSWPMIINLTNSSPSVAFGPQNITANGYTMWHSGNDGTGTGLDADLLDGQQGSYYAKYDHIRSLGTTAFTGGTNPNITTAQLISEMESDGAFDSYTSVFKTSWSYAGNYNLSDAGRFTETAGTSFLTWTDNSSDSTRGNITVLAVAPNTGGSAGRMFVYNDQGSTYAPGWREIWTNTSDGAGSGLDADLLDGVQGSSYLRSDTSDTFNGTLTMAGTLTLGNNNITGVNHIVINDPGVNEGIQWTGGNNWYIQECPDNMTNASGNLQFSTGTTRRVTITTGGSLNATADVIAYSDERVKTNIKTIDNALEKVCNLRGVNYNRTDLEDKSDKIGVIAQEVEKVLPEVVQYSEDADVYSVAYGNMAGVFIEAIKEQQKQIEALKARIDELENK